jgi:hypothetical protein
LARPNPFSVYRTYKLDLTAQVTANTNIPVFTGHAPYNAIKTDITSLHLYRWVDNIKMDLKEIGWDIMDWIELAQDRDQWSALVNAVMNLRVP